MDADRSGYEETSWTYNNAGLLSSITNSDSTPGVQYGSHDQAGRVLTVTDASGQRSLTYSNGVLAEEQYTGGLLNGARVERGFDSLARLEEITATYTAQQIYEAGYTYDAGGRLSTVSGLGVNASYGYLSNSQHVATITVSQNQSQRLQINQGWDNLNRLISQASTPSASTAQSYGYDYDERGRRTKREQSGGYYWNYGYDSKNQLASAVKKNDTATTLPGYDWSYDYDDIGNRASVTDSGEESNYTVNAVNQYTQRQVPRLMRFRGLAHPDAVVTLTEDAITTGALMQVDSLSGEAHWLAQADYTGASGPNDHRAADFTIEGVLAGAGHNNSDAKAEAAVSGLLAPNPESFTYDDDGNLTRDAYWDYTWDGENRLIAMEHRADLESFFDLNGLERKRLEFVYDSQSRRVQKEVFYRDTVNNLWVPQESRRFLYDDWNPLVELVSTGALYTVERTYLWGLDIAEQAGNPTRGNRSARSRVELADYWRSTPKMRRLPCSPPTTATAASWPSSMPQTANTWPNTSTDPSVNCCVQRVQWQARTPLATPPSTPMQRADCSTTAIAIMCRRRVDG